MDKEREEEMSKTFIAEVGQKSAVVDEVESLDSTENNNSVSKEPEGANFPEVKIEPPKANGQISEDNKSEEFNESTQEEVKTVEPVTPSVDLSGTIPGYEKESFIYENEKKPKKKNPIVTILLMILCLGIGVGGTYYYFEVYNQKDNTETTKKETEEKKEEKEETNSKKEETTIGFDASKCINNKTNNYTLSDSSSFISVKLGQDQKSVNLKINWNSYGPQVGITDSSNDIGEYAITNFSKKIVDVFIGEFGQAAGEETILYLMEDGTVEYTPIVKAKKSNNFASFGILNGVDNIVKFYSTSASVPNGSGYITVIAQKADGTFYDLSTIIKETGNY